MPRAAFGLMLCFALARSITLEWSASLVTPPLPSVQPSGYRNFMFDQNPPATKNINRPRKTPTAVVRLPVDVIEAADTYAAEHAISRAEAIRRFVALGARGRRALIL